MKFSDKGSFNIADVCRIIEEASKNGVMNFKFGDLEISFKDVQRLQATAPVFIHQELQKAADSQAREATNRQNKIISEEELEQMSIEDPLSFEKMLRLSGDSRNEEA
jgi:restriction endonuclease Mrr